MGAVVGILAGKGGGGGKEARVPAHDDADVYAGNGAVVQIHAGKGLGHVFGGRTISRAVVRDLEVVVDGFGHVNHAEFITGGVGFFVDDAARVGAVVAAAVVEVAHIVGAADFENFLAVFLVRLVTRGQQARGRGRSHGVQIRFRRFGEVEEVLFDNAADAVQGAIDMGDFRVFFRFQDGAYHALIDHGGRPAALGDQHFAFQSRHATSPLARKLGQNTKETRKPGSELSHADSNCFNRPK